MKVAYLMSCKNNNSFDELSGITGNRIFIVGSALFGYFPFKCIPNVVKLGESVPYLASFLKMLILTIKFERSTSVFGGVVCLGLYLPPEKMPREKT